MASLALLGALLAAPGASASHGKPLPGDSAIDQYLPGVPGPGGERTPKPGEGKNGALPPSSAQQLESLGAAGVATAALAEATDAGSAAGAREDSGAQPGGGAASGAPTTDSDAKAGGSVPADLLEAATGGGPGGMGFALPIILGAAMLATLALLFARRFRTPRPR